MDWYKIKDRMAPTKDRVNWEELKKNYPKWREEGRWITGGLWFGFDITHSYMVGTENLLMAMLEEPEWVMDMFNHELDVSMALLQQVWDAGYTFDEVHWYDGGLLPERPAGLEPGKDLNMQGGGAIFYGTKDTLICGCYGVNPYLVSGRVPNAPKMLREIKESHQMDWVRACKEDADDRVPSASDFSEAGPFNEMVVMGVLAVRLQSLNRELLWDGENMRFTNIPDDATIRTVIKDGFHIKDGHPTFDKTWTDPVNAQQFAQELIKHTYRDGWKLPDMPL